MVFPVRGHFRSKKNQIFLFEGIFGAKNIGLTCPRALSELGAWKSFLKVFFLLNFSLGSGRKKGKTTGNSEEKDLQKQFR